MKNGGINYFRLAVIGMLAILAWVAMEAVTAQDPAASVMMLAQLAGLAAFSISLSFILCGTGWAQKLGYLGGCCGVALTSFYADDTYVPIAVCGVWALALAIVRMIKFVQPGSPTRGDTLLQINLLMVTLAYCTITVIVTGFFGRKSPPTGRMFMGLPPTSGIIVFTMIYGAVFTILGTRLMPRSGGPRWLSSPGKLRDRKSMRGVTLIELLIVVAILAITVPSIVHIVHMSAEHSARSREAMEATTLVRNEFEKLRAGVVPLEEGVYTTQERIPFTVSIGPAGENGLHEVTMTADVGSEWFREQLVFEGLVAQTAQEAEDANR